MRLLAIVPAVVLVGAVAVIGTASQRDGAADGSLTDLSSHAAHSGGEAASDEASTAQGSAPDLADASAVDPAAVATADPESPAAKATGTTLAHAAGSGTPERNGAEGLGEAREPVNPADVVTSSTALGGCHPSYGGAGQCLPLIPPSQAAHAAEMVAAGEDLASMQHPWTCTELLTDFPDGVAVREVADFAARDPYGLDLDGDLIACSAA